MGDNEELEESEVELIIDFLKSNKDIEEDEEKAMEYVSTMIKKIEGLHDYSCNQGNQANQENHGLDE